MYELKSIKGESNEKDGTHFSYGTFKGIYIIDDDILDDVCSDANCFKYYGLVEHKSEYYRLFFDFDYKEKMKDIINMRISLNKLQNI